MSTDQRRALAATTPTTEVIKDAVTFPRERLGEPLDISPERFEAWLARVRRDAAREALDGLADHESRLVSENNLFQDKANHLFASQAAGRYRYDNYPEEAP